MTFNTGATRPQNMRKPEQSHFAQEVDLIYSKLFQQETEESWDTIAKSITKLGDICKSSAGDCPTEVVSFVRSASRPLTSAMISERTRLSGIAINFLAELAPLLGRSFDPLLAPFFPTVLSLCARPNKVFITRARTCILTIVEATQSPSILSHLVPALQDKSTSLRLTATESLLACLNCFNPPDLERPDRAQEIETAIRTTARDASADVRKVSRKVFEAYKVLLPGRVANFIAPLSPVTRKYLDVPAKPSASVPGLLPPRPQTSQGHNSSQSVIQSKKPQLSTSHSTHFVPTASSTPVARRHEPQVAATSSKPVLPEGLNRARSRAASRTRDEHPGDPRNQFPRTDVASLLTSQPASSVPTSSTARKRTISAPAKPSFAKRSDGHTNCVEDQPSGPTRPTVPAQADVARRHELHTTVIVPSVPGQSQKPRMNVRTAQTGNEDLDALIRGEGARRIPIPDPPPKSSTGDSMRPLAKPISRTELSSSRRQDPAHRVDSMKPLARPMSRADLSTSMTGSRRQDSAPRVDLSTSKNGAGDSTKAVARPASRAELSTSVTSSKRQDSAPRVEISTSVASSRRQEPAPRVVPTHATAAHRKGKEVPRPISTVNRGPPTSLTSSSSAGEPKTVHKLATGAKSASGTRDDGKQGEAGKASVAPLARAKKTASVDKAALAKPIWGRHAPRTVTSTSTKSQAEPKPTRPTQKVTAKAEKAQQRSMVSPLSSPAPQQVPLPPSPTPELSGGEKPSDQDIHDQEVTSPAPCEVEVVDLAVMQGDYVSEAAQIDGNNAEDIAPAVAPAPEREVHIGIGGNVIVDGETTPVWDKRKDVLFPPNLMDTPITSLLSSIQQGFVMTPSSPLSPPQSYIGYKITGNGESGAVFGVRPTLAQNVREPVFGAPSKSLQAPLDSGRPKWPSEDRRAVLSNVEINH